MRLERLVYFAVEVLLGISLVTPASAQAISTNTSATTTSATLNGTLTDPSDAAVAGAIITAQALDVVGNGVRARSGPEGKFTLALAPGRYRVTITHPSFQHAEREFALAVNEARTWDVRLQLEKMSSRVVVSATAEPLTTEASSSPVDVITKEDIERRGEIWAIPMLTSVPGITLSRLGAFGGITTFFLDGGNSSYAKVVIDGAAVNDPGNEEDYSYLTLDNIDKIEVVHGAASVLYGSDANSGVVQIFTHRGTTTTPELTLEGDGGTFQSGHGLARLSGLLGAFDYSASAGYFSTEGQGPEDRFHDATFSGNFGWRFSPTNNVRLALRDNTSDGEQQGQILFGPPSPGQSIGLDNFSANLGWDAAAGSHWQNHLAGFESRNVQSVVDPPFGTFVSQFNRAGFDERAAYLFHNGTFSGGYEYEVENGPSEGRHNQAGYLEAHYQFGPRFSATTGVRADANGKFGTRVVPRVGGVYLLRKGSEPWGATRLRGSYGEGIKEPELLPLDCSANLKPEVSRTFDAGIEQLFASDRLRLSINAFANRFYDIVSFDFLTNTPNCIAFGGSFFNTDLARAYGSNASFEIKAARWLNISGNYTYDDSKVLRSPNATDPALVPGNRLFKRPLHSANLAFNATVRHTYWTLAGNYVGRRADSDFLSFISDGVCMGPCITSNPSYVRWDIATVLPLHYGLSATARVENLFNNHYKDSVGYPGLRLNYRIGLKYVWGRE